MVVVKTFGLVVASIVTVVTMLHAAGQTIDLVTLGFLLWGISPYFCFFAVTYLLERFTSIPRITTIGGVISILMLGFTLLAYIGTLGDKSSTYGLIFIFIPIYLYVGSFVLLAISVLVSWLASRRTRSAR